MVSIVRIQRIDQALEKCESHLASKDTDKIEVASLLAQSLLILICAQFEHKIKDLIKERCSSVSDNFLKNFVVQGTGKILRSPAIDQITELLGLFDGSCKEAFKYDLNQNGKNRQMYDSILINRNQFAHGGNSHASFDDVKQYYQHAHVALDYFRKALFQNADGSANDSGQAPAN